MKLFVVMCLVAAACADKQGYNYQPGGHSGSGLSFGPGSGIGSAILSGSITRPSSDGSDDEGLNGGGLNGRGLNGGAYNGRGSNGRGGGLNGGGLNGGGLNGGGLNGGGLNGGGLNGGGLNGGGLNGGGLNGGGLNDGYLNALGPVGELDGGRGSSSSNDNSFSPHGEVEKEFYTYTAPESAFDDPNLAQEALNSVKKAIRVIFIKGPENKGLENAALSLAKQAAQQKTAIYVLNKQPDINDLAQKLSNISKNSSNRPEVHFVKYRTPEDAANAQKAIQSQYDDIDGPSTNINGGVAPVISFASQSPVQGGSSKTPQNAYLPSSVFLRRQRR